jgi:outer membrane receptor for monomeric catechols
LGLSLRAALFQTDKLNLTNGSHKFTAQRSCRQARAGFQAELNGHLSAKWDAQASYAYLDATLRSSNFYPAAIGARLANVPRHTLSFWQTYRLPSFIRIGAGGSFVGARTSSSTVPFDATTGLVKQAPGYWVFNAMIERRLPNALPSPMLQLGGSLLLRSAALPHCSAARSARSASASGSNCHAAADCRFIDGRTGAPGATNPIPRIGLIG